MIVGMKSFNNDLKNTPNVFFLKEKSSRACWKAARKTQHLAGSFAFGEGEMKSKWRCKQVKT